MKTLEDLKRTLRTDICEWCPVYEPDEPCTLETRGPNSAMCQKAKDERARYIWEEFCEPLHKHFNVPTHEMDD